MKFVAAKCPECGGALQIPEDRDKVFCTYCGCQIIVDEGPNSFTYRKVNVARIKEAELNARLEEKRIDNDFVNKIMTNKRAMVIGAIGLVLCVGSVLLFWDSAGPYDPRWFITLIGLLLLFQASTDML